MINLILGPPGGGKSYEAVVYHILPALTAGRKVITNLPLDLERLRQIDASFPALIQTVENHVGWLNAETSGKNVKGWRTEDEEKTEGIIRAFANVSDYADPWRHATDGSGPFYVIDECHLALPLKGTSIAVEEWFSLHRHESADVLLITQSFGKVSRSIIDLVQVCYKVRKATTFGSSTRYIRKVQDGVRGDVVNTGIRKYEKRYFGLYKSHTRGGGSELCPEDVNPIWKRWPFLGAAIMIPLAVVIYFAGGSPNILKPSPQGKFIPNAAASLLKASESESKGVAAAVAVKEPEPEAHPFAGRTLHVIGSLLSKAGKKYLFAVAQNGQKVSDVSSDDLIKLGYKVEPTTDCVVKIGFGKWSNWLICDAPQISIAPSSREGVQSGSRSGHPA